METTLDRLTLALLPGLVPRSTAALLRRGPLGEALARPDAHSDLLGEGARAALRSGEARRRAEAEGRRAAALGVRVVGSHEDGYPDWLRRIHDAPPVLFVRGRSFATKAPARSRSWAPGCRRPTAWRSPDAWPATSPARG